MPAQIDSAISPAERAPDLAAEPAADVGCDDADAVLGDAEDPRVQQPGRVRGLRRRLHGELAADRVVLSRCSLSRSCSLGPSTQEDDPVTLTQLSAFVLVARLGTVKAAATALGVSEPAVSQAIAARRRYLDDLLTRTGNGMELTAVGSRLLTIAAQMVSLGAAARGAQRARRVRNGPPRRRVHRAVFRIDRGDGRGVGDGGEEPARRPAARRCGVGTRSVGWTGPHQ
jgi:Bacterial regulatory helix-turn-helix protein, lysR family